MTLDPIHHHILEQRIQRDAQEMIPHHLTIDVARDPHTDDRRSRLTRRAHEARSLHARRRLGRAIERLGQSMQGNRQEIERHPSTTRS